MTITVSRIGFAEVGGAFVVGGGFSYLTTWQSMSTMGDKNGGRNATKNFEYPRAR